MDAQRERRALQAGVHIVVGTPGRLRDHIERGALDVSALAIVVLDEADEMLDLGFREDLEFMLSAMPAEKRSLLFSATVPKGIATLARSYQRDAMRIEVERGKQGHVDIEYRAIRIYPQESEAAVVNLLRLVESPTAIVFCNTREAVRHLSATLTERGFSAVTLSGELSQHERNQAMQALRNGRSRVLVATDVAARGHRSAQCRHRHSRRSAPRRRDASASERAHRPRRQEGHQRHSDAVRASHERRTAVRGGGHRTGSGSGRRPRLKCARSTPSVSSPIRRWPSPRPRTTGNGAPPARRAQRRRDSGGAGAALSRAPAGDRGRHRPRRAPAARAARGRSIASVPPRADASRRRIATTAKPARAGGKHALAGGGAWFRIDVGRAKGADPKWLLPMICRAGGLTKADIGTIRVFDHETKFEISAEAAAKFTADIKKRIGETPRIEPLGPSREGGRATKVGGKPDKRTRQARKAQRDA